MAEARAADNKAPRKPERLPEGVGEHDRFQRRVWLVQRAAWIIFGLVLITCLLGFTGRGGPFSWHRLTFDHGSIELPAIARWNAPDDLRVTFDPSDEAPNLVIDQRFLDAFSIESVDPPQFTATFEGGRILYAFPPDPSGRSVAIFRVKAQKPWLRRFTIGLGKDVVETSVFIFP
ncbi:hypothetical protein [Rhizobium sp. BK251]|uniref:hypothetical protein n=1 Tax=Rhizobium sp. BK251 TaxID=2512125 RepID=UPI00104916D6|nr:hypothetical protein [Rhizobium sp. BK251]TCL63609.1 hypothetical protein EV286_1164 [Rhizobium sp. BK251]